MSTKQCLMWLLKSLLFVALFDSVVPLFFCEVTSGPWRTQNRRLNQLRTFSALIYLSYRPRNTLHQNDQLWISQTALRRELTYSSSKWGFVQHALVVFVSQNQFHWQTKFVLNPAIQPSASQTYKFTFSARRRKFQFSQSSEWWIGYC